MMRFMYRILPHILFGNQTKENEVEWNVALLGEKEDTYRVFVGKPE
jgi:hypothetical protein